MLVALPATHVSALGIACGGGGCEGSGRVIHLCCNACRTSRRSEGFRVISARTKDLASSVMFTHWGPLKLYFASFSCKMQHDRL
jgi:hypothetical protein